MTKVPTADSSPLGSQVAAYLQAFIIQNGLRPNDVLPGEVEISQALGISRPVVREAARGLATLGVITVAPGRRPRVARVTGAPIRNVFEHALITGQATPLQMLELRRGVEVAMASLAATRRGPQALPAIRDLLARMGKVIRDRAAYAQLDFEFHLAIAHASDNPVYTLLIEASQTAFVRTILVGLRSRAEESELLRVQHLHERIFEAIERQDASGAADAMMRHFEEAQAALSGIPLGCVDGFDRDEAEGQ